VVVIKRLIRKVNNLLEVSASKNNFFFQLIKIFFKKKLFLFLFLFFRETMVASTDEENIDEKSPEISTNSEILLNIWRPILASSAIFVAFLLFELFHTLPEYCEQYEWSTWNGNKKTHHVSTSFDMVMGLNIIFLIQSGIFLWFGILHLLAYIFARVNLSVALQYDEWYSKLDSLTIGVAVFFYVMVGIVILVLMIIMASACEYPILIPMIAACADAFLFTVFGHIVIAIAAGALCLGLAIVFAPFYLVYLILVAMCDGMYSEVAPNEG